MAVSPVMQDSMSASVNLGQCTADASVSSKGSVDEASSGYFGNRKKGNRYITVGNKEELSSNLNFIPHVLRKQQFFKTKVCPWFFKGTCDRGDECQFAHHETELRRAPDLSKTSFCRNMRIYGVCKVNNCKYAHHFDELRATGEMYKTTLCTRWLTGRCCVGDSCRHAHGDAEKRDLPCKTSLSGESNNDENEVLSCTDICKSVNDQSSSAMNIHISCNKGTEIVTNTSIPQNLNSNSTSTSNSPSRASDTIAMMLNSTEDRDESETKESTLRDASTMLSPLIPQLPLYGDNNTPNILPLPNGSAENIPILQTDYHNYENFDFSHTQNIPRFIPDDHFVMGPEIDIQRPLLPFPQNHVDSMNIPNHMYSNNSYNCNNISNFNSNMINHNNNSDMNNSHCINRDIHFFPHYMNNDKHNHSHNFVYNQIEEFIDNGLHKKNMEHMYSEHFPRNNLPFSDMHVQHEHVEHNMDLPSFNHNQRSRYSNQRRKSSFNNFNHNISQGSS